MLALRTTLAATVIAFASLTPIAAAEDLTHDDHSAHQTDMADHQVGDLMLKAPFARATLPNQPVAGAFLTITNMGDEADTLIGVSAPFADRGEIHEMAMDGETMRMRELADGLVIPAGVTVELKPGGYHLMFMKLQEPLVEDEMVEATLEFEKAGTITIPFSVEGKGATSIDHSDHGT